MWNISFVRLVILCISVIFNSVSNASNPVSWLNGSSDTFDIQYQRTLLHVVALERFVAGRPDNLFKDLSPKGSNVSDVPKDPRTLWDTHVCLIPQLFSTFQREQWNKAREELRIYDVERVMNSYKRPAIGDVGYDPFFLKFYLHPYYLLRMTTNGHNLRGSAAGKKVQVNYFTIYKAASTYLHNLLVDFCKSLDSDKRSCNWSDMYIFEWIKKERMKRQKISLRKSDGQYSFAVVRDPIARFISGFTELEQRRRDKNATEPKLVKAEVDQSKPPPVVQPKRLSMKCLKGMKCALPPKVPLILDSESKRRHWEEKINQDDRLETFIFWLLRYDGSHSMVRECPECDHITPQGELD